MKTTLIFVVGFAVLAVAAGRRLLKDDGTPEEYTELTFERLLMSAAQWSQKNDAEYRKALNTKPQPAAPGQFPSPDSLTLESDPIVLGEEIAKLSKDDQGKKVDQLENLISENMGSMQAVFYKAALKAIHSPEEASQDWSETVQKVNNYGKRMAATFPGIDNLFGDNTLLANITNIIKANPLGAAKASNLPIMLYIGKDSSDGSLVVASTFNTISSSNGKVKGGIQRLILDRIAENGGVEEYYRTFFSSASA